MFRPRIRVLAAAVLAGALLGVPVASASGVEADSTAAPQQKFLLISVDPEVEGGPIAATGAIHAKGNDVITGNRTDRFEFPDGNVNLRHKPKKSSQHETFDPVSCLFTFTEKGTWTTEGGTGAYTGVQGSGTYKVVGEGIGCDENKPPEAFYIRILAKGDLTY